MYEFHYKEIKNKYNVKLLLTDTDSLFYEIKTDDIQEDLYADKNLFDFTDYPRHSMSFDLVNKNVIGKAKDEFKEKITDDFVGLKLKMYKA